MGDFMERIIMHIDVNSAFLSWSSIKLLKEGSKIDLRNEIAVVSGKEEKKWIPMAIRLLIIKRKNNDKNERLFNNFSFYIINYTSSFVLSNIFT